jgi:transposase InsO family protein
MPWRERSAMEEKVSFEGNMRYCYPLMVMDSCSRYVLEVAGMHRPTLERTKAVFEALLEEYGLPEQIHTDNGEPFASAVSLSRLTRLSVWFMDLGTVPVYSDPGHPEHNGSDERMHKELKAEAIRPPGYSLGRQQQKFDEFRQEYNEIRPHQALGSKGRRSCTTDRQGNIGRSPGRGTIRKGWTCATCAATEPSAGEPGSWSWYLQH